MNWTNLSVICGYLSFIPIIIGFIKFKKIDNRYKPFIYLLAIYSLFEITSLTLVRFNQIAIVTILMNFFVLFDFLFLYMLISFWEGRELKWLQYIILAIGVAIWISDNFLINSILRTNSIFRIAYSFIICIKSIDLINKQFMSTIRNLRRNPFFIIGLTFLMFYSYKIIFETIYFINIFKNQNVSYNAFGILIIINLISYLLYSIAILCMEKKIKLSSIY